MIDTAYIENIQKLRRERDARIKANPLTWLSLVGLFQLEEGDNPFGGSETGGISLPGLPRERCGSFNLKDGKVAVTAAKGSSITVNGEAATDQWLKTDKDGKPDLIEIGTLAIKIIQRGADLYLRVWDRESPDWKNFQGYKYYPVKPEYCITADYIVYDSPRVIKVQDVIGNMSDGHFPGEVHFAVNGMECKLIAEDDGDELLFNFTDMTREDTTYPGGRNITTPNLKMAG